MSVGATPVPKGTCTESVCQISRTAAGGSSPFMSLLPKLLMNWEDITAGHRDVPAEFFIFELLPELFYFRVYRPLQFCRFQDSECYLYVEI